MNVPRLRRLAGTERASLVEVRSWIGWVVDDVHGSRIGRLEDVLPDDKGLVADWLIVNEFRFGRRRRFSIPAVDAVGSRGRIWVPFQRDVVRNSGDIGLEGKDARADLLRYYDLTGHSRAA